MLIPLSFQSTIIVVVVVFPLAVVVTVVLATVAVVVIGCFKGNKPKMRKAQQASIFGAKRKVMKNLVYEQGREVGIQSSFGFVNGEI